MVNKIIVHGGIFHADDVFAVALAWLLFGKLPVERRFPTAEELQDKTVLVMDTGQDLNPALNNFDHHQMVEGKDKHYARPNGVPYAAFGLVWRYLGYMEKLADLHGLVDDVQVQGLKDSVESSLVHGIDATDNGKVDFPKGVFPMSISHCINILNPTVTTWGGGDAEFAKAVDFAGQIIMGKIRNTAFAISSQEKVLNAVAALDGQVLVLDEYAPWQTSMLLRPEQEKLMFCVHPSSQPQGGYMVVQVPTEPGATDGRCSLPASWAGLDIDTLQKVSGVADATFCHANRFCGAARSEAGAMSMALKALEQAATLA